MASGVERRFCEGVQAYLRDDLSKALHSFEASSAKDSRNISDDFFAGIVAMRLDDVPKAIGFLERVVTSAVGLPDPLMQKYLPPGRVQLSLSVSITPQVQVTTGLNSLTAALILAEAYQTTGRLEEAIGLLQQLSSEAEDDPALKLSLCDLLYADGDDEGVVEVAEGLNNDSDIGIAGLHLKAKALARKGLNSAAFETFAACLKKTAGRDPELLKEIRYDRAVHYEVVGQPARARKDWEKLYADDPRYRDVAKRLSAG